MQEGTRGEVKDAAFVPQSLEQGTCRSSDEYHEEGLVPPTSTSSNEYEGLVASDNRVPHRAEKSSGNAPEDKIRAWAREEDWPKIEKILSSNLTQGMKIKYALTKGIDKHFWFGCDPNLFHWALAKDAPLAFIEFLLNMGGKEGGKTLVEKRDEHGVIGLFRAFFHSGNESSNITVETLRSMVDIGGIDLVYGEDEYKSNILHYVCMATNPTPAVIDLVMEYFDPEKGTLQNGQERNEKERIELLKKRTKLLNTRRTFGLHKKLPIDVLLRQSKYSTFPLDAVVHLQKILYSFDPFLRDLPEDGMSNTLRWIQSKSYDEVNVILEGEYFRAMLNKITIEPLTIGTMLLDLVMQLFVVVSCSFLMKKEEDISVLPFTLLTISTAWLLFRELLQLWSETFYQYVKDTSNWLDCIQLVLLIVTLFLHDEVHQTLIISILVSWLRLVFVFGDMIYPISVFTSALLQIFQALYPFLFVTVIIVMAFSHSFHALGPLEGIDCPLNTTSATHWDEGGWSCSLSNSYFESAVMFLSGDWIYLDNFSGPHTWLSMTFAFIVGILLLNIIIALVSNVFTDVESNGAKAFWSNRLHFINDLEIIKLMSGPLPKLRGDLLKPLANWRGDNHLERGFIPKWDVYTDQISARDKNRYLNGVNDEALKSALGWFYRIPLRDKNGDVVYRVLTMVQKESEHGAACWQFREGEVYYGKCPSLLERIVFIFSVVEWQEIFPPSKACRKILMGKSYFDQFVVNDMVEDTSDYRPDYCQILGSYLAALFFVIFTMNGFLIAFVLGLFTGGYFWPEEIKRYLFCGDVEDKIGGTVTAAEVDNLRTEVSESQKSTQMEVSKLLKNIMMEVKDSERNIRTEVSNLQKNINMEVSESQKKVEERMSNLEEKTDQILKLLQVKPIRQAIAWG